MKKLLRALSLLLVLALIGLTPLAEEAPADDPVVAAIGEQVLRLSDVEYYAQSLASYGIIETVNDVRGTVDYALRYYLIPRAKVAEYGVEALLGDSYADCVATAEAEYEATLDNYVAYFAQEGDDVAALRQEAADYFASEGFDKEAFVAEILIGNAYDALMDSLDFGITDEQIEAEYALAVQQYEDYFATNIDMYEYYVNYYGYDVPYRPEGYRGVLHILLTADDELLAAYASAAGEEAAAAAKEAIIASLQEPIDAIYARLAAGEAFADILPEYNEDPGMSGANLTDGYAVHASSILYMQEFTDGAFSEKMQKPGDVSDPVVTSYGVHILYYLRDIPGGAEPMSEEDYAEIRQYLIDAAEVEQVEKWLEEAEVEYTETYYALIGE